MSGIDPRQDQTEKKPQQADEMLFRIIRVSEILAKGQVSPSTDEVMEKEQQHAKLLPDNSDTVS